MRHALAHALFVSALLGGLTAVASADKPRRPPDASPKPQHMIFDGEDVEAERWSPEGLLIDATRPTRKDSLIKVRTEFVRELLKSAEDR